MKLLLFGSLALVMIYYTGCSSTKNAISKGLLQVYYVPFDMSTEGRLLESEVKDLSVPYVSYYCTSDVIIIDKLKEFFSSKDLTKEETIKDVAPYMIIEYYSKGNGSDKIVVGPSVFFKKGNQVYLISKEMRLWLEENIPIAGFPSGIRSTPCTQ